ncbi:40989_t:CDS:2, partial [Gigaspora margarita]
KNGSLEATKIKPECCTSNPLPVSENKNKKQDTDNDDNSDISEPTLKCKKLSTTSKISRSDSNELYQVSDEDSNEINSKDNNKVIIREEEQRWDQLIQE